MSFAIMRIEKRKSENIRGMQIHNERKTKAHSNLDIDTSKSNLNYSLVHCDDYVKKIDEELEKRYTGNKAIRKDAVICSEVVFTSDLEFFQKIGKEREKIFFEKSLKFIEEKFGKENVISAKIHKDETTPHMHLIFVPLHQDGSLSMKKHLNGRADFSKIQDEFFKEISKEFPELERGKSVSETKEKHKKLQEYKTKSDFYDKKLESEIQISESLKTLVEIESRKRKNIIYTGVSITDNDFSTLIAMAKNSAKNKEKLKELSKENEELKNSDQNYKKQLEINQELRTENFDLKFHKGKSEKYLNFLEKELLEKSPEILRGLQTQYIKNLAFGAERDGFIKEKSQQKKLDKQLQKNLGIER